jgi:hypothetical protein
MRLRLLTQVLPHPFGSEPTATHELWGEVCLVYQNDDHEIVLLKHQWDLFKLAEWSTEDGCAFMTTLLPEKPRDDESLAEALQRLSQRSDESFATGAESEAWFEALFEFRKAHSSRFALKGANVPEVIVGFNRGSAEVSRCDGERWSYPFELDEFKSNFVDGMIRITESAGAAPGGPELQERLAVVRSKLRACSKQGAKKLDGEK